MLRSATKLPADRLCIVFAGAAEFGVAAEKVSISAVEMLTRIAAELQPTAQSLLSKGMRPQDVLRMIQVMMAASRQPSTALLCVLESWSCCGCCTLFFTGCS